MGGSQFFQMCEVVFVMKDYHDPDFESVLKVLLLVVFSCFCYVVGHIQNTPKIP